MTEITSLGVFCGSRTGDDPAWAEAAGRLGEEIAGRSIRLVYGGGGIVGAMGPWGQVLHCNIFHCDFS